MPAPLSPEDQAWVERISELPPNDPERIAALRSTIALAAFNGSGYQPAAGPEEKRLAAAAVDRRQQVRQRAINWSAELVQARGMDRYKNWVDLVFPANEIDARIRYIESMQPEASAPAAEAATGIPAQDYTARHSAETIRPNGTVYDGLGQRPDPYTQLRPDALDAEAARRQEPILGAGSP